MQRCRDALGPEKEWKLHAQPQIRYFKHDFEAQGTSLKNGQKSKSQKIEKWCEMLSSGMAAIKISNSQSLGDLAPGLLRFSLLAVSHGGGKGCCSRPR